MTVSSYPAGTRVRLKATLRNNADALVDPTSLVFTYQLPGAVASVSKTYPTDVEVVRESLGIFYIDVQMDTPGRVRWRVHSTGVNIAAQQKKINIEARYFD